MLTLQRWLKYCFQLTTNQTWPQTRKDVLRHTVWRKQDYALPGQQQTYLENSDDIIVEINIRKFKKTLE
jgi:hypothetical protein